MDAHQPPPPFMRPPSGPPPPADPYHQYYQYPARPPVPPPAQPGGGPAWYSNQFHNPHSPSPPPPPPPQWGPPSAYPPFPTHSHQPPFNAGANGNSHFPVPAGAPPPPPYHQANQEWGNPNWGPQQGHTSQANSNVEDWAVKAKEWAAANEDQQHSQSAPNQPSGQVYQQYPNHGYQDVHQQQAAPGLSYQQFQVPPTTQPERYPNYAAGNETFHGGSFAGLSHQENLPTSSAIHQQEVPYSYSSVSGAEESVNATQHEVQTSVPDGGGPVRTEQQMQYAYGDQIAAPPSNLGDQPLQFATRESSDYPSHHNAWPPHAATEVVYPPVPSSVPSMPQHDSSMAMPPVSGHTMPPYGRFPPPDLQPVGPPNYAFGTKPPLHPVAAFMDNSYAASSVPPKKTPVPNWLKEELLKNKASLGRPSSGSFEERESMDDDLLYKPPVEVDHRDDRRFSSSKSSDEEEEEDDEDETDAAKTIAINLEIKRILTEVLLKVTDELFDEIATKVINEDAAIPKDDNVQHNPTSSSSLLSAADPVHKASAKILVSVGGANKKPGSGSPADVLGLGSYASDDDDDDADTDAPSNADADGSDGVLGTGSRNDVHQQPSTEKLPEPKEMVNARLDPEVEVGDMSHKNNKSGLDQILGPRRNDDVGVRNKNLDASASSGLDVDTSGSRTNHSDRTDSDKDAILDEPHRKNTGLKSDSNLRQDSNKSSGKELSDDVSRDRTRTDETKTGKEKVDSQNGSKDRMKQTDIKPAEKVKGLESDKKSTDLHVKKDSRDAERSHRTSSKEDRGKKREKEKEEERSRHRHAEDKRRRLSTSNGSSDDSTRKSRSRRRNISPSPVRSRRKRSSPSSDESSDDSRRKSSSKRRNRSPSPGRSKRRHVSSRSPHSKNSQRKHTLHSSHDTSRSKRSRSRSPRRRHRA